MAIEKFDKFILDNMREETIQTVLREVRKLLKREYSKKVFSWPQWTTVRVDIEDKLTLSSVLTQVRSHCDWFCRIIRDSHQSHIYDIQWKVDHVIIPNEPNCFFVRIIPTPTHREDFLTVEDALELATRGLYKPLRKNNGRVKYNG